MNKIIYRRTLDLERPGVQHTIYAKKNDALSRELAISLKVGGSSYLIAEGVSAFLFGKGKDNTILNECSIEGNCIIAPLTTNMLASDELLLEVRLTDTEGAILGTPKILIISEDSLYSDDTIEAKDDFSALLRAITSAENAKISSIESDENVITITYNGGDTVSFEIKTVKGEDGRDGVDGTLWHFGTHISGDGDSIIYPMIEAKGGDFYFNNDTGEVYVALGSTEDTASAWKYLGTMRGEDGEPGVDGFSPTVSVIAIDGGHRVTITDKGGAKSFDVLNGEASGNVPTKVSQLENDSGFITKAVADLVNYYTKYQSYSKDEVNALISAIPKFAISVVSSLPTSNISSTTVYLVKTGTDGDLYTEWIYVGGKWEVLGSQRVDLTGYATESWVNIKLADYMLTSQLQSAINTALAQAKASGEFDGKDGDDGVSPTVTVSNIEGGHRITITDKNGPKTVDVMDGYDGRGIKSVVLTSGNGSAGTTDTYTITYTDNTTSTFSVYNGKNGSNGSNGSNGTSVTVTNVSTSTADGGNNVVTFSDGKTLTVKNGSKGSTGATGSKGDKGDPYTLTEADKAEIVQSVLDGIGSPVYGFMGEDNHITLKGNLAEDRNYTFAYEMDNGTIIDIGKAEFAPEGQSYTNQIPISTDTDGSVYGFKSDSYISSSDGSISSRAGIYVTGFIPCTVDDVIRFENLEFNGNSANANYLRIGIYDSSKGFVAYTTSASDVKVRNLEKDSEGNWKSFQLGTTYTAAAFIRVSCENLSEDSIITINEEITGGSSKPSYTNQIPISTDTDGSVYGFKSDTYISSSSGAVSAKTGICTTGFIPCGIDDVIRFENLEFNENASNANYYRLAGYDKDKQLIKIINATSPDAVSGAQQDSNGVWKKFILGANFPNVAFIRVCCAGITKDSIITINEEIV